MSEFKELSRSVKGLTVLVTGAASGMGRATARVFAAEGANVAVTDFDEQGALSVAKEIAANAGSAKAWKLDVADGGEIKRVVGDVAAHFGGLDIVVNNAGISHRNQPMLDVSEEEFDRVFAVNVKSIYLMAQATIPHMRQRGGGVILNIGSTAGIRPRPGLTWYNATKGAVNLLSKSMAVELAPDRIRVNAIAPVAGETPLLATFMGEDTPEKRAAFKASIPWGRLSTPQDIANAALFLCSDDAEMVTGEVLQVDGGRCI